MHSEGYFEAADGTALYHQGWLPSGKPRAHIAVVHGYGEHSGRYTAPAEFFNAHGFAVHAYDHRYHGRSPGRRGFIARFQNLVDDLGAYLRWLESAVGDAPFFVLAHSMGGLVTARRIQTQGLGARGVIFSSAFLALPDVSPVLLSLGRILSVAAPWLPVANLPADAISRDPAAVQAYDTDPLVHHGRVPARTGAEFNEAVAKARANAAAIHLPAYIIHGTDDRLVPVEASQYLHGHAGSEDKTLKIYDGGYHELMHDLDREQVLQEVLAWLDARCTEEAPAR